ncbi:MAG: hypothetical protein N2D54_05380 [Chloroflexota bacterium]
MDTGMLWFDNDQASPLFQKVEKAASYYQKKYGNTPNLCYIHPKMALNESAQAGPVKIKSSRTILPHYFWIGVDKKE